MPRTQTEQSTYTLVGEYFLRAQALVTPAATPGGPETVTAELHRIGQVIGYLGDQTYVIEFTQFAEGLRNYDDDTQGHRIGEDNWEHRELVTLDQLTTDWVRYFDDVDVAVTSIEMLYEELDLWTARERDMKEWKRKDNLNRYRSLAEIEQETKQLTTTPPILAQIQELPELATV